jgi:RND family efflux transporter MFP subunit
VIILVGISGFFLYKTQFAPLEVKGISVKRGDLEVTVTATSLGTVKSEEEVSITAQRAGKIIDLYFDEGDRVKAGALIAKLDTSEVLANLKKAEADLKQAEINLSKIKREYERKEILYKEKLLTKQQFEDVETRLLLAKAALESAKAARDIAKLQYEYSFIKTPVSGVVTERPVEVGDTTVSGQKIASVVNPDVLYISAPIDEADVDNVALGQIVRITMDAYPERVFKGKVIKISPIVTGARQETRTFEVRVSVPDENIILKPGMSADVEIITGKARNTLIVPSQTVIDEGSEQIVYVAEEGKAKRRVVKTGLFNWNFTEIKEGLVEGEIVIFTPDNPGFKEGVKVKVVNSSQGY